MSGKRGGTLPRGRTLARTARATLARGRMRALPTRATLPRAVVLALPVCAALSLALGFALPAVAPAQTGVIETEIRSGAGPAAPDSSRSGILVQTRPERRSTVREPGLAEETISRRIYRLRRLLNRDSERALRELEALLATHPANSELRLTLGRAYRDLGRLAESEALLRSLVEDHPESTGYRDEFLRTLFMLGNDDEALAILERSFATDRPHAAPYEDAAALLQVVGRYELVEGIYRRGLAALPGDDEGGRLRLLKRLFEHLNLEDRPEEMLRLLANEVPSFQNAQRREGLLRYGQKLIAESTEPGRLLALADSLASSEAGSFLAPALRDIYLAVGDYEAFAERVLQTEQNPVRRPVWLYEEGVRCLTARGGDPAERRRAAESIFTAMLALEPNEELAGRGRLQLARIRLEGDAELRLRGETPGEDELRELRALLAQLRQEHPSSFWAAEALVAELHLLRERLGLPAVADSLLRAWLVNPRRGQDIESHWALELELGENLMALERFDEAREHYAFLLKTTRSRILQGWARYRSYQLLVLAGQEAAAQDSLAALAKQEPGGLLANDALDLALLLAEAQNWPGPVREFLAGSLRLEFSIRPAEAAERLLAFARDFPEDAAAPALLYRAGLLLQRGYRGREAVEAWLLLADLHADDFRAAQGLELAARLALRMDDRALARELLARLLDEHPESPLRPCLRDLQVELAKDV